LHNLGLPSPALAIEQLYALPRLHAQHLHMARGISGQIQ
jgi:hypothetical protein